MIEVCCLMFDEGQWLLVIVEWLVCCWFEYTIGLINSSPFINLCWQSAIYNNMHA